MLTKKTKFFTITVFVFLGIIIGVLLTSNLDLTPEGFATDVEQESNSSKSHFTSLTDTDVQIPAYSNDFSVIAKKILPTVVSIATTKIVKQSGSDDFWGPILKDFFGRDYQFRDPGPQELQGLGSGILINSEGYILTNHHVINNADDITVTLYDNRSFEAEIIGSDPLTEVAVVRINGADLPHAPLGNSDLVEIGNWVIAIGNPLELTSTVTAGIVSAKGRDINIIRDETDDETGGSYAIENFIQTDAAINKGNSGGALVNMKGEVIGINTAIASGTGYYAGYGFAIPINLAKRIVTDLIEQGHVIRPYVGISMRPVNEAVAQRYNLNRISGVYIEQVLDDTPAEKGGLKELDLILKLDDKEIDQGNQVQNYIAMQKPGDVVTFTILRESSAGKLKKIGIEVTLGTKDLEKSHSENENQDTITDLGLEVHNLTDEIRNRIDEYKYEEGVIVMNVTPSSPADKANIQRLSLINRIEDIEITSVSDFRKALKNIDKDVVIFYLKYRDRKYHAFVRIK
ncbi:MAG: Do family serine endopeptidase [bacterium]